MLTDWNRELAASEVLLSALTTSLPLFHPSTKVARSLSHVIFLLWFSFYFSIFLKAATILFKNGEEENRARKRRGKEREKEPTYL